MIARQSGVPVFVAAIRHDAGLMAERELEPERRAVRAQAERERAALAREQEQLAAARNQLALANENPSGAESGGAGTSDSLALTQRKQEPQPFVDLPPLHLLDDGFQHRQLARTVNILIMNRKDWMDTLLPSGNLREPHKAIHRASVVAIPAQDVELEFALRKWGWQCPIGSFIAS